MGEIAYQSVDEAKRVFYVASEVSGVDLAEVCFGSETERLNETLIAQPAIAAAHIADGLYLENLGIRPDVGVGHSVGEFPLLALARVLPMRDTFSLLQVRAEATYRESQERPGMMAAVSGLTAEQVRGRAQAILAGGRTAIANFNGKKQQVFSGDHKPMEELEELIRGMRLAEKLKVSYKKLATGGAFHSHYHMENAVGEVHEEAKRYKYYDPTFEIMLNNTRYLSEVGTANLPEYISGQLVNGVNFVDSVDRLIVDGVTNYTELGKKAPNSKNKTLSGLIMRDFEDLVRIIEINEVNSQKEAPKADS
jgi:[acyl-carrier-protein] S-malonyltransferase